MDQAVPSALPRAATPEVAANAVVALLEAQGHCDARTIERGRRLAADGGQRLDRVLLQLGLVNERDLAAAFATLLGPAGSRAGALPGESRRARLACRTVSAPCPRFAYRQDRSWADPGDGRSAGPLRGGPLHRPPRVAASASKSLCRSNWRRRSNASIPTRTTQPRPEAAEDATGLEDDVERLKDLASEAPVIRLVNQIIQRAVETQASDIHVEPFEDRLRVRYRYDGVLQEAESPPVRLTPRHHLPPQDHVAPGHRRTGWLPSGRPHQARRAWNGD